MKVGVYVGDAAPDTGGGFSFQSDLLEALLSVAGESDHSFVLLCEASHADAINAKITSSNVSVVKLPQLTIADRIQAMLLRDFAYVRTKWRPPGRLQRISLKERLDYVWFLGSDCQYLDVPYCAIVWDIQHRTLPWFPEVSHGGEWDAREASNSWFLRRAASVITGTKVGADEIARFYQVQPNLINVLPHPTPRFALKAGPNKAQDVLARYNVKPPYLIYPAQFWAHKNHVNLLHALKILRDGGSNDVQLVLLGSDKGNLAYCKTVASELGVQDALRFPGFIPREDLISLYRNAAGLAYVSFGGPENLPPLEAFALGCPVVAADIPGAREQLQNCVLYVDPANPEDIASACRRVISDARLREELIMKGQARAVSWTGENFVRGMFGVLDRFAPIRRTWPS